MPVWRSDSQVRAGRVTLAPGEEKVVAVEPEIDVAMLTPIGVGALNNIALLGWDAESITIKNSSLTDSYDVAWMARLK